MDISKIALYSSDNKYDNMSAHDVMIDMLDHTDKNGVLYIPEWPYDNRYEECERFYKCIMNWNSDALKITKHTYDSLYESIKTAVKINALTEDKAVFPDEYLSDEYLEIWNKYFSDFEADNIDADLISDITDRYKTISLIESIKKKICNNDIISKEELEFFNDYKDTFVSEEEKKIYADYTEAVHAEAKRRIGDGLAAYDVLIRVKRLFKLLSVAAPDIVINNEEKLLAQAMVVHYWCVEMETVDLNGIQ